MVTIGNQKDIEKVDQELVESSFHPHLLNVQTPSVDGVDQHFYVQLNCELVWHWRKIQERKLLESLQKAWFRVRKYVYAKTWKNN